MSAFAPRKPKLWMHLPLWGRPGDWESQQSKRSTPDGYLLHNLAEHMYSASRHSHLGDRGDRG